MNNPFDVLIYLDETLVRNLSSLVLTGFIETTTLTQSFDRTLSAGLNVGDKIENSNQGSISKTEREGYKDKNKLDANNNFEQHHVDKSIDGRQCVREEKQVRTTYTTFVLNRSLMDYFQENNSLQNKIETDIENNNIFSGELIELEGVITNQSFVAYLDTLISLITIFEPEFLDGLVKENKCGINFSMFLKMITYLKNVLSCNNTEDLIMKTGNGTAILTINKNNFMNNECNMFDKINCHCKVVGKVIKTCTAENDSISLFRKTGQEKFFESFFKKCKCLLDTLEENGIIMPEPPQHRISEKAVQIMPLSIYV